MTTKKMQYEQKKNTPQPQQRDQRVKNFLLIDFRGDGEIFAVG